MIRLALLLACLALPALADPPPPEGPAIDGDAFHACIEVADTEGKAGRAVCAGAASRACVAEAGHPEGRAACLDRERRLWEAMAADWVRLVAEELTGEARADFLRSADRWHGDGSCRARWDPGEPESLVRVARCRLKAWARRVDALIARYP